MLNNLDAYIKYHNISLSYINDAYGLHVFSSHTFAYIISHHQRQSREASPLCKRCLCGIWTSFGVLPRLQLCKVPGLHSNSFPFRCLLSVDDKPLMSSH